MSDDTYIDIDDNNGDDSDISFESNVHYLPGADAAVPPPRESPAATRRRARVRRLIAKKPKPPKKQNLRSCHISALANAMVMVTQEANNGGVPECTFETVKPKAQDPIGLFENDSGFYELGAQLILNYEEYDVTLRSYALPFGSHWDRRHIMTINMPIYSGEDEESRFKTWDVYTRAWFGKDRFGKPESWFVVAPNGQRQTFMSFVMEHHPDMVDKVDEYDHYIFPEKNDLVMPAAYNPRPVRKTPKPSVVGGQAMGMKEPKPK